jgi:endogenous inhibitor of DNA gyrase (YacG/DUF329 family)
MDTRICKHCGKEFHCAWEARDILCSPECRRLRRLEQCRQYKRDRKRMRPSGKDAKKASSENGNLKQRRCRWCNQMFVTEANKRTSFCSQECRRVYYNEYCKKYYQRTKHIAYERKRALRNKAKNISRRLAETPDVSYNQSTLMQLSGDKLVTALTRCLRREAVYVGTRGTASAEDITARNNNYGATIAGDHRSKVR